jgi:hypothetical protein
MSDSSLVSLDPPHPNDRVVAFEVHGQMTTDDMKTMVHALQTIVDRGDKALLLIDMTDYEGFEWGVVSEKFKHLGMLWGALDKYAILGDDRWMENWIKLIDPLTPQQIKHFAPEDRDAAWVWLTA